ncbi:DHHC zinc finger domain containing protein [Histomonas meleagridis]|uniref:DHHC zinc finger domain containing protein n=1 Tax=Histomonas meleagridis TaxID=135588 RepID=UPI003559DE74|nr:DHHC zinc finger domain containing protein [Histomonas meleagridis]KAH0796410.1 DHHC zinc finger domain containing protein [Histomonas meleagridis]
MDPGFLPYDWVKTKKFKYSYEEQLSGLAIREDQFRFAETHKPPFASFSHRSGRYVIRADHICVWVSNWIGKRNHKQFTLMLIYGVLYCLALILWGVYLFPSIKTQTTLFLFTLVAMMFELSFGSGMLIMLASNLYNLRMGKTQLQRWKNQNLTNKGCCENLKEICGDGPRFAWAIPTPAFGDDLRISYNDDDENTLE